MPSMQRVKIWNVAKRAHCLIVIVLVGGVVVTGRAVMGLTTGLWGSSITNCVTGDQHVSKGKGWLGVGNKRLLLAQGVGSVLCVGWRYPARK